MTPRKVHGLPRNLTFDKQSGRYRYRFTETGRRIWVGTEKDHAIDRAKRLNIASKLQRDMRVLGNISPLFSQVIDSYIENVVPTMQWSGVTPVNHITALNLYKNELGSLPLINVDRLVISNWISERGGTGSNRSRHRLRFVRLFEYAISQKWCDYNEGDAVPKFSRSKKLQQNKVTRKRMTLDQFWLIHDSAPLYMQVAMQLSLVTLQSRQEVLNMKYSDIRNGYLYVIRKKTSGDSDNAFIRIPVSAEIERIVSLSRTSKIVSPFIVHRLPRSKSRHQKYKSPHPTWIKPAKFTINFAYLRNKLGITDQYQNGEAPTFHEIRSLGARLMEQSGVSKKQVSLLMAHGAVKTTDIYLDGRDEITDDRYITASTSLVIKR